MKPYALGMIPAFKDYLWGGRRLVTELHKDCDLPVAAESWEVSCHPDGLSRIANGPLAGQTLAAALAKHPGWMGTACAGRTEFPLLIKLIDAERDLSLQVHPEDDYARRVEGQQGKNELWYVVDAAPGARLTVGFREAVARERLAAMIGDGIILEAAHSTPVKRGDCYCIPAGLLHAIGAGTLIAEVQQNSNVTYRVYDYGRVGADGKPRQLHVEQALDVIDTGLSTRNVAQNIPAERDGYRETALTDWPHFAVSLLAVEEKAALRCGAESFQCLLLVEGRLMLEHGADALELPLGGSAFLPAGLGDYTLRGQGKALLARV